VNGKAYDVRTTELAERDLAEMHAYLRSEGAGQAADRLLDRLLEAADSLERFPERGAVPPEASTLEFEVRQLIVAPYRLFYRLEGMHVIVFLIAHGRRDMRTLLQSRLLRR